MFSKACEYGIRAVIYIWSQNNKGLKLGVKDICKEIDAPEFFTAKILQSLAKQDLVSSTKGPNGGFYISEDQENMRLLDLVEAQSPIHAPFTMTIKKLEKTWLNCFQRKR